MCVCVFMPVPFVCFVLFCFALPLLCVCLVVLFGWDIVCFLACLLVCLFACVLVCSCVRLCVCVCLFVCLLVCCVYVGGGFRRVVTRRMPGPHWARLQALSS